MHSELGIAIGVIALLGGLLQLAKACLELYLLRRRDRRHRIDPDE
jgi:hypothetical protein